MTVKGLTTVAGAVGEGADYLNNNIFIPLGPMALEVSGPLEMVSMGAEAITAVRGAAEVTEVAEAGAAMARGRASETRVLGEMGLAKNTQAVSTAEGKSIPDALTHTLSVEVKDTARVSLTAQVRIQTGAAKASERTSVLVTGQNTRVSSNAAKAFDQIIRRDDLGPPQ